MLAHYFGYKPWELGRLTPIEFREHLEFIKKINTPPPA